MQVQPDSQSGLIVQQCDANQVVINQVTYCHPVALNQETILENPLTLALDSITFEQVQHWITPRDQLILIGSGQKPQRLREEQHQSFYQHGLGIEIMDTPSACRTFNLLSADRRPCLTLLYINLESQ